MCGIAGVIAKTGFDPLILDRMSLLIRHRGPDDEGYALYDERTVTACGGADTATQSFANPDVSWRPNGTLVSRFGEKYTVGFAHRRLSIVDLSPFGHQPMSYRDRYWITYNGEVYNYLELRGELEGLGHEFQTRSDTEVILAAYAQWGESCLNRFNGMWALAVLDTEMQRVFIARDRFGVKPLYLAKSGGTLYFASEIKPLLAAIPKTKPNLERVISFLVSGISDSTSETFFADVTKLDAGCFAVIDIAAGELSVKRYYNLDEEVARRYGPGNSFPSETISADYLAQFDEIFLDAIKLRLRSDVPVGTCLSGGLDSSAIASVAGPAYARSAGAAFTAVTGISTQQDNDESEYAKSIAERLGLNWRTIRPTYPDFASSIDEVMRIQEEPFGGASIVMQYHVMKRARAAGLPVMLDGQGGDEVLLGYAWYYGPWLIELLKKGRLVAACRAYRAMRENNAQFASIVQTLKFLFGNLRAGMRHRYQMTAHRYLPASIAVSSDVHVLARGATNVRKAQLLDIGCTNLPALLRFEDKNSMAFAVETRLPFLDYRLVEFCLGLPHGQKIKDGWSKWLLRRWATERLPTQIVWQRKKLGFPAPDKEWEAAHRTKMLAEISASRLIMELSTGGGQSMEEWLKSAHGAPLWRLYSVALWDRIFFG